MIDLTIMQSWLQKSSDSAVEEYKSALSTLLNNNYVDRHTEKRWDITKVTEDDVAYLIYDEKPIATLKFENDSLRFLAEGEEVQRFNDLMFALRSTARHLGFAVYSNQHNGARLPADPSLVLDHTYFKQNADFAKFLQNSPFIARYCVERYESQGDKTVVTINPPFYFEAKDSGKIYLVNTPMLQYLIKKDNQEINNEFALLVAGSLQEFAKKDDYGLVPSDFYKYLNSSAKIINNTSFDVDHIDRKVFVDPYIWDFDAEHDDRFYQNTENGMHLMDKVRNGETLDEALKRMLVEEFKLDDDYVGARIWGLDFDRDRDGILTPRLKMNIYIHGLTAQHRSNEHDWVSVK